jgi:hypothetical protein
MAHDSLTLSDEDVAALGRAVASLGAEEVARRLGCGREPVIRMLARIPVRRGTLALATAGLPALTAA